MALKTLLQTCLNKYIQVNVVLVLGLEQSFEVYWDLQIHFSLGFPNLVTLWGVWQFWQGDLFYSFALSKYQNVRISVVLWFLLVDSAGICHRISIISGIFDRFRREGTIAFLQE